MAVAATIMESLFQRTLDDIVKGLRVQMVGEARYLAKALEEVRKEIKSTDPHTKVVALQKLTYLNMLQGTEMGWASFHVIEVMSMSKFSHKKIGYLAASQTFHEDTDVLVLITNLLRKDLCSKNEYEAGLALDCLSRIATADLARDLTPEVFTMLASSRSYVRKKATLVLFRVFCKYPDSIKVAFKRLVEKMEDPDPQVVSAAVSVLCELAMQDSKPYLMLAPEFHRLLAGPCSNWMCIKLVKIFGVLSPLEPRLGPKIAEPICDHMRKTSAKSLLLECIRTVMAGLAVQQDSVTLSVEKLQGLLAEDDPNLKYLGLKTLATIMPTHPWAVAENKEVIVRCLEDGDMSIQMASLTLIMGMVTESNLVETVQVLLQYVHSTEPQFSNELIACILSSCSHALYELVSDFSWYVNVLGEIARVPHNEHGEEVGRQLIDIGLRVADVREDLVRVARYLLLDPALLGIPSLHPVLSAAAWVSGEYASFSHNAYELIQSLLQPRTQLLPSGVHAIYLQAVLKVFILFSLASLEDQAEQQPSEHPDAVNHDMDSSPIEDPFPPRANGHVSSDANDHLENDHQSSAAIENEDFPGRTRKSFLGGGSLSTLENLLEENVSPLVSNVSMEVQERACNILGLLEVLREAHGSLKEQVHSTSSGELHSVQDVAILHAMRSVFEKELGPVSVHAQDRVVVPEGLVFETNLDALGPIVGAYEGASEGTGETGKVGSSGQQSQREWDGGPTFVPHHKQEGSASANEGAARLAQHRQRNEAYYLAKDGPDPSDDMDYPPPRVSSLDDLTPGERLAQDVLSGQNKSKSKKTKIRPVVVKLEDECVVPETSKGKKVLKDEFMVNAIREIFSVDSVSRHKSGTAAEGQQGAELGRQSSSSKHRRRSHRPSKAPENVVKAEMSGGSAEAHVPSSDGNRVEDGSSGLQVVETAAHKVSSRSKGKKKKEKEPSGSKVYDEVGEAESVENNSGKHRQRHSSKHQRHRARSNIELIPEASVTPDFLL